jgi:hypothetical protein
MNNFEKFCSRRQATEKREAFMARKEDKAGLFWAHAAIAVFCFVLLASAIGS